MLARLNLPPLRLRIRCSNEAKAGFILHLPLAVNRTLSIDIGRQHQKQTLY